MKNTKRNKILLVLFCVILPLLLVLLSYKIILYISHTTTAQEKVFHFLAGKENLSPEFTALEVSHLQDVKRVMNYADYIFYILLLLVTVMITYFGQNKKFLAQLCEYGGKVSVVSMLVIVGLAVLFFDTIFTLFHSIFFPQGNWQFAADSTIIQTFPIDFFMSISRNIFLLSLFLGMIFILLGHYFKNVHDNRN